MQGSYGGRYTRAGSVIIFDWTGSSVAGPLGATGTLRADSLVVRYDLIMRMLDFIDGAYVQSRGTR